MNLNAEGNDFSYSFCHSRDISDPLTLRISSLEGKLPSIKGSLLHEDPVLRHRGTSQSTSECLAELIVTVQIYSDGVPLTLVEQTLSKSFKSKWIWNEWLELPIAYNELPRDALIAINIWDSGGPECRTLLGGTTLNVFSHKSTLKRGKQRCLIHQNQAADVSRASLTPHKIPRKTKMDELEKIIKKYDRGDVPPIQWLDNLSFRQIERIHAETVEDSKDLYLYIDLPKFGLPVIYSEKQYVMPSLPAIPVPVAGPAQVSHSVSPMTWYSQNMSIPDPEMARENPVEAKLRKMVRDQRTTPLDRAMKPNSNSRDEINLILKLPPTEALSPDAKNILWKFRFYLSRDKKALTKFLRAVTWSDAAEAKQATELLLPQWAPVDVEDALELLGPNFDNFKVRQYAVNCLERADDEELILYLLQLVQALKFEPLDHRKANSRSVEENGLVDLLIGRSIKNEIFGNSFFWYMKVEAEDKLSGRLYENVLTTYTNRLKLSSDGQQRMGVIKNQQKFVTVLTKLAIELRSSRESRLIKIEKLKNFISDPRNNLNQFETIPLPLDASIKINGIIASESSVFKSNLFPLRLHFTCEADDAAVEESANAAPTLPTGTSIKNYPVIFKDGDDLRQDQLVIQLINLMDRLLRKENLDLRLSPYRVLATGPLQGMVQYVPSTTLQAILSEHNGSILPYLRQSNAEESSAGTFGIKPWVLDNFVRSCAGYCVITYILGVGDRHMDNLLIAPDGHFFHVDFGYILGRDPKPFPPPMKICKEMIEAMGGSQSVHYTRFRSYCYTAFTTLRKQANLILNLFALMIKANIPDIRSEPDKVVSKVREKFRLDLGEEEAIQYFQMLMDNTLSGFAVVFMDRVHSLAQYWRS